MRARRALRVYVGGAESASGRFEAMSVSTQRGASVCLSGRRCPVGVSCLHPGTARASRISAAGCRLKS